MKVGIISVLHSGKHYYDITTHSGGVDSGGKNKYFFINDPLHELSHEEAMAHAMEYYQTH